MESNNKVVKRQSSQAALKKNLVEYCRSSSVHGFQYIGENRPILERLFWVFMIVFSLIFCGFMIWEVYMKWETSPVIVNFAEKSTPIWEIPFPAITVCPITKARQSAFNYTEIYWAKYKLLEQNISNSSNNHIFNISNEDSKTFNYLAQVCKPAPFWYIDDPVLEDYSDFVEKLRQVGDSFMTETSCIFKNQGPCRRIFNEIITADGLCYTFNGLDGRDIYRMENIDENFMYYKAPKKAKWTLENGYESDDQNLYPYRVSTASEISALELTMDTDDKEQDYQCQSMYEGYKIAIHEPGKLVTRSANTKVFVSPRQLITVSVKPQMMETSEQLQYYSPNRRQCYFSHERYLKFFQRYDEQSCDIECFANYTLRACGCSHFSLPRSKNTPICGVSQNITICYKNATIHYLQENSTHLQGDEILCNCLPLCTSLNYDIEVSTTELKFGEFVKDFLGNIDIRGSRSSVLKIYFKDAQFITLKRYELYGLVDFMANCGGLLGLFMGFSMLSLIELIYFCSLRLLNNFKNKFPHDVSGENVASMVEQ